MEQQSRDDFAKSLPEENRIRSLSKDDVIQSQAEMIKKLQEEVAKLTKEKQTLSEMEENRIRSLSKDIQSQTEIIKKLQGEVAKLTKEKQTLIKQSEKYVQEKQAQAEMIKRLFNIFRIFNS